MADALWMGVPVLTVAGESMVSRQAASVLRGIGCEQWICRDASEMVDQALSLSNDHNQLQQLRLQQRQRVASSELLDHAGLAASLEGTFRNWWFNWLQQQGWTTNAKQHSWKEITQPEPQAQLTPVRNSVSKRLPLWLGPIPGAERQRLENLGKRIIELKSLEPWGEAVTLFARAAQQSIGLARKGTSSKSRDWWPTPILNWCGNEETTSTAMKLLLVHQNFRVIRDLGPALCDRGHELSYRQQQTSPHPRIEVLRYNLLWANVLGLSPQPGG